MRPINDNYPKGTIPPAQKIAILTIYNAARKVAYRHFENSYEAEGLALYWSGLATGEELHLTTPALRLAIALDRSPHEVMKHLTIYHKLNDREPQKMAVAYAEYRGLSRKWRRKRPFYVVGEDGYPVADAKGRLMRNRQW